MESTPFNAAGVKYIVVGAFAYARYARPRATGHLDIWIERSDESAPRAFGALVGFGAPLGDLTASDFASAGFYYSFGRPPVEIDIVTEITGVTPLPFLLLGARRSCATNARPGD